MVVVVVVSVVMVGRLVERVIVVVDATPVAENKTNLLAADVRTSQLRKTTRKVECAK